MDIDPARQEAFQDGIEEIEDAQRMMGSQAMRSNHLDLRHEFIVLKSGLRLSLAITNSGFLLSLRQDLVHFGVQPNVELPTSPLDRCTAPEGCNPHGQSKDLSAQPGVEELAEISPCAIT